MATPDPSVDPSVDPSDPSPPPLTTSCPVDAEARFEAVVAHMRSALDAAGVPGGVVTVVCAGRPPFVAAHGITREGSTDVVTVDTRFQWASISKMFTAATALSLERDGIVALDVPLDRYLPATRWDGLTLHHLLTHTGGFPTMFDQQSADLADVVARNASMQLWASPGAVWVYSNPGFAVVGRVLEVAAGEPFAELVRSRALAPYGMEATMDVGVVEAGPHAFGHTRDTTYPGPIAPRDAYFHTTYYQPMGGIWGSARDFGRWAEAHMEDAALRAMHEPRASTTTPGTRMGYATFIEPSEPRWLHHGGGAPGFGAEFHVIPGAGFGVAVVVNADWYDIYEVVDDALTQFEIDVTFENDDWTRGLEASDRYVGVYDGVSELGQVEVTASGSRLFASIAGGSPQELSWVWGDSFEVPFAGDTIDLSFWRESEAAPASYVVSLWGVAARRP